MLFSGLLPTSLLFPLVVGAVLGTVPADTDDPPTEHEPTGIEWAAVNLTSAK